MKSRTYIGEPRGERIGKFEYFLQDDYENGVVYQTLYKKCDSSGRRIKIFDPLADKIVTLRNLERHTIEKINFDDSDEKLAVILDLENNENNIGYVKDLKLGKVLKPGIKQCSNIVFSKDENFVYYCKKDQNL